MFGLDPDGLAASRSIRTYRKMRAYYRIVSGREQVGGVPGVTVEHTGVVLESDATII